MPTAFTLAKHGISVDNLLRNASPGELYEAAIKYEDGTAISSDGALMISSGKKTGRSPKDKRIVDHPSSSDNIWWGSINIKMDEDTFQINRSLAIDSLNTCDRLYVCDGFAGWSGCEWYMPTTSRPSTRASFSIFKSSRGSIS